MRTFRVLTLLGILITCAPRIAAADWLIAPFIGLTFKGETTLFDPEQLPNQESRVLRWPYVEGLRMDEAMNPLTLLTFGSYGQTLANQQGAPIRVIVPWKYGFKSAKSIERIRFVDKQPRTTWNDMASDEYGFYSNVNPQVDHPRWSQAHERLLNSNSILPKYVPTLMFNGYDEVASMYAGMDLKKNY